jgi:hypothetical protein
MAPIMWCGTILFMAALGLSVLSARAEEDDWDINEAPHFYQQRIPSDRITRMKGALESGQVALDVSSEKAFLVSLLKHLEVPLSSQLLVFSTTSLQLSRISPSSPRAIYFSDEVYVGYVPGGRIEVVALDPELGGIFYIFDIPSTQKPIRLERSDRCMNCHAGSETGYVPGLALKSVMPGPSGGSLTAYRIDLTGHDIPLSERLGGWHVTGQGSFTNHHGNLTGALVAGVVQTVPNLPGARFSWDRYPVATSDLLAHLILEHQAGFVNRVLGASYRARTWLHVGQGRLSPSQEADLDRQARSLVRYLLFAEEVPLPGGGVEGDAAFKAAFLRDRKTVMPAGESLKDLDLQTKLFKHRCSFMIYTPIFSGLPADMKQRVYANLKRALDSAGQAGDFAYLGAEESRTIRRILKGTLADLPRDW